MGKSVEKFLDPRLHSVTCLPGGVREAEFTVGGSGRPLNSLSVHGWCHPSLSPWASKDNRRWPTTVQTPGLTRWTHEQAPACPCSPTSVQVLQDTLALTGFPACLWLLWLFLFSMTEHKGQPLPKLASSYPRCLSSQSVRAVPLEPHGTENHISHRHTRVAYILAHNACMLLV